MKNWKFAKKVEGMTPKELRQRIQEGYDYKMPNIVAVPYVGEVNERVTYDYLELVAKCPMTGILDTYRVIIDYIPNKLLPELKSLKLYFLAFEDLPISHEHLGSKIYKEVSLALKPIGLLVRLLTKVRGGIYTTISKGDINVSSDLTIRKMEW